MSDQAPRPIQIFRIAAAAMLWVLLLCLPASAGASEPAGCMLHTLEDPTGKLDVREVRARLAVPGAWVEHPVDWIPNFGSSPSVFWIRRTCPTPPGDTSARFLLVASSVIDHMDIHIETGGSLQGPLVFGDRHSYLGRPFHYRQFAVPWRPAADGGATVFYLRTGTHDGLHESVPISCLTSREFGDKTYLDQFLFGIYFGVIGFLALFSFLLFLTLRERSQLFFSLYALCFGLWNLIYHGFADSLLWPDRARSNFGIMATSLAFATFLALFTSSFLDLRKERPRLNRVILAILGSGAAGAVPLMLLDRYRAFFLLTLAMDLVLLPLLLWAALSCALRGRPEGKVYLASWTLVIAGALLYIGKVLGAMPASAMIEAAYLIGTIFQVIVLSIGVALQVMLRQRQTNIDLESLVKVRTHDLEDANHRLKELSDTDFLTGLFNRRHFLERFAAIGRAESPDRNGIALLLLDIDHFKLYNDSYGHLAGDACLRAVAQAIRGSLNRGGDFCARFGGEEFIICLPGTDGQGACTVAEQVRRNVESLGLEHRTSPTAPVVTLSIGIAGASLGESLESMSHRADIALYQAKSQGRNRICQA